MIQAADIYVLAGIIASENETWTLRQLAEKLSVDHTLIHRALKRAESVELYLPLRQQVHLPNFEEMLVHGGRFLAPAKLGELVPGVPAAWVVEPMASLIKEAHDEPPPVWPSPTGSVRGQALEPLHPAAVGVIEMFAGLGGLLAVIDSLRAGDLRVRQVAAKELRRLLQHSSKNKALV